MKRLKRLLIALFVLVWLLIGAIYWMAPGMILHPYKANRPFTLEQYDLPYDSLQITSFDGTLLKGVWVRADSAAKRPIILLQHGVGNCKESWYGTANWLWKAGYSTVIMDSRAHGQSGGRCCTYGFFEKQDVSKVIDHVLSRDSSLRIGIWGHSMGGAIALQALATDPRLKFGIVESTFSYFRQIVYDYQWRMFKISSHAFADNAIARAAAQGGFDPDAVQPGQSAKNIHCPMFMAHGTDDEKISFSYGQFNFSQLASADKQFYAVQGAHHNDRFDYGGQAYVDAILAFLGRASQGE